MSETWTSDPDGNASFDDAYRRVCAGFIVRRGRGAALSAADTDAIESWLARGYSWLEILRAIDTAFAKLRTPPRSLRTCEKYLPKREHSDELLDPTILAAAFGGGATSTSEAIQTQSPAADACKALAEAAAATEDARAKSAYQTLLQEIREREEEGPIDLDTVALFDEALALIGLELLAEHERIAIQGRVSQAPANLRARTLLEAVGQALDLEYPNLGRLHGA